MCDKVDTSPAAIAEIMDGVLPGPWDMSKCQCGSPWCNQYIISNQGPVGFEKVDANFIAAARELVPALAAERDALRAAAEKMAKALRNIALSADAVECRTLLDAEIMRNIASIARASRDEWDAAK